MKVEDMPFEQRQQWNEAKKANYLNNVMPKHIELIDKFKIPHKISADRKHFILRIKSRDKDYFTDYYPHTGKWKVRLTKAEGRGIPKLFRYFRITWSKNGPPEKR